MTIGYIICCFFQISVFKTGRPLVDDLVDLIDKYLQIVITTMIVYYSVRSQFRSSFNGSSLICHSTFSRRFRHFVLLTIYQFKMHFNEFLLIEFFLYLISRKKWVQIFWNIFLIIKKNTQLVIKFLTFFVSFSRREAL